MIDLQIHTAATPHHASWTPDSLVQAAIAAGLSAVAATDHNTMGSVRALLTAGAHAGIRVIPGVEIDSGFGGKLWHVLVYGVAPEHAALLALCDAVFSRNQADAAALRERLMARGFQLDALAALDRPTNVADVATALAAANTLPGRTANEPDESAGMRYILQVLPGSYRPVSVDEIVGVAHAAGGKVVLAHPGRSKGVYAIPADEVDIAALVEVGIDGIEVYYPMHTSEQQARYQELARRYHLLVTGGSDSHGPQQPLARWPEELCRDFLDAVA